MLISSVILTELKIECIIIGVISEPVWIYARENAAAITVSGAIEGI